MTTKRKLVYPDFDLVCDVCARRFRTPQGLSGHKRMVHAAAGAAEPSAGPDNGPSGGSAAGSAGGSIKELRAEVDELKLQVEKRKLQAELPSAAAEPADLMQQLGLGPFDPAVRAVVQRRAVNAPEHEPQQSWLDKLLSSPEGVKVAVDGLRGVLGVGRGESGDNLSTLLKDLGFSLKDLLLERAAPKGDPGLTIGGVSLAGTSLTPELLKSVLDYRSAEEKSKADFDSRKLMADSLKDAISQLAPAIGDLLAGRQRGPGPIQRQPGQDLGQGQGQESVSCPRCGDAIPIPLGFTGGELRCQAKLADGSCLGKVNLEVIEDRPESKARGKKRKPEASLKCADCGQLIDISSRELGDEIRCPVCESQFKVVSDRESLPALEALSEKEKQDRAFRDRKGGL